MRQSLGRAGQAFLRSAGRRIPRTTRWRIYWVLERYPPLFMAVKRARSNKDWQLVDERSDIVIEGFPASANSFARRALKSANPEARIASHVHSWAHVAYAMKLGKPALVLVRPPVDSIASRMVRFGIEDPRKQLQLYIDFHRGMQRLQSRYVVADFDEVTNRFGDVIRRVNDTFGTSFVPFDHDDPANTEAIFAEMDKREVRVEGAIWTVARPLADRKAASAAAKTRLAAPEFAASLARCQRLYEEVLTSGAATR